MIMFVSTEIITSKIEYNISAKGNTLKKTGKKKGALYIKVNVICLFLHQSKDK